MSIDWITVFAQVANFLLLVWLLKRFLYRPILDGIDAREAEISRRMSEAGEAQEKANSAEAQYTNQQLQLLSEQETMVDQALKASQSQRDTLLADARAKMEQEHKDWRKHLEQERQKFTTALERAAAETLLELTRKVLRDLADETLEDAIVRHVGARLRPIAEKLNRAAGGSTEVEAITHAELPVATRNQLQAELDQLLPGTSVLFTTDPQQAPGVILRVGGAQVAWTIDSYTNEFDAILRERMAAGSSGRVQSDVG